MPIIYPQLDGVKINVDRTLPVAILQGIRKAYDYLTEVSAALVQVSASLAGARTPGAIPKVNAVGNLTESSLTDNGIVVSGTETLLLDTISGESQIKLRSAGGGGLELLDLGAANAQILFDETADGTGTPLAMDTSVARLQKIATNFRLKGAIGQTVGTAVTDVVLITVALGTGDTIFTGFVDTVGVYKVAGTQVVGPRGAALTAAAAYGGGIFGGTYTATEQTLANALVTQVTNLKTRLDQVEARLQSHGLIT